MIRQLRITLKGRVYDVTVEEVAATSAATGSPTAAAATTMVAMPGPFVPPTKAAMAETVTAATATATVPAMGGPGDRLAPLAGVIFDINVKVGDVVAVDDPLVVLEAMKMKTVVGAHKAGRIAAIHVSAGDAVDADQPLVTIS